MNEAFQNLGINVVRVNQTVTIDGSSTAALASTRAFLVGTQTEEPGKPVLFVRKRMNEIQGLPGIVTESGDLPERLVFIGPNPIRISSSYLGVSITGYGEIASACTNPQQNAWGLLLVIIIEKFDHIGGHPKNRTILREGLRNQELATTTRRTSYMWN